MTCKTLVLLPGLLCDARIWRDQSHDLSADRRVIVVDLTRDDCIESMASRVLAEVPGNFALAGLSMGGYVAFEIMRTASDRVTKLALIATSAAPDSPQRVAERRAAIESLSHGRFNGVTSRLLSRIVYEDQKSEPLAQEVREMAARVGSETFLRQQTAILQRGDYRSLLPRIAVPTLVVVGDSDRLTPPETAASIHHGIAGSQFRILPRCGHLPPMEAPQTTTGLLRAWLDA